MISFQTLPKLQNYLKFAKYLSTLNKKATVYVTKSTNIVFNLSTEEFFYEHQNITKPVLILYQNDKNVVIGKHQNPWKECNIKLMEEEKITLARRRSGGGAVYQDLGNLCYAFFLPHDPSIEFRQINTQIMINSFKSLDIPIESSGRNDLICEGRKISGNAFKINMRKSGFAPKSLHHGTILLNVDMDNMQRYLNPNKLKLISKGVDSVRSRVLNLNEKYPHLTKDIVYDAIEKAFLKFHGVNEGEYDKVYIEDENNNKEDKIKELFNYYNSWEWKFGESPEFTNSLVHKFDWGLVDLSLLVEKGKIQESTVYSDCLNIEFIDNLNKTLKELKGKFAYNPNGVKRLLEVVKELDEEICESETYSKYVDEMIEVFVKHV